MTISSTPERVWWKQPLDRVEAHLDRDRLRLVPDHVLHDAVLAHLR